MVTLAPEGTINAQGQGVAVDVTVGVKVMVGVEVLVGVEVHVVPVGVGV